MKQTCLTVLALLTMALCLEAGAQDTKVKKEDDKLKSKITTADGKELKMKKEDDKIVIKGEGVGKDMVYPYTAEYSSQFVPGNPAHAKLILDMWKAWDDNALDRQVPHIADTITMQMPDGNLLKGKTSFLDESKKYRDKYTTVKSNVEMWMPIKSVDRNETWVAIWGTEEAADKDGSVTVQNLHELWRINKDGKIDYMRQYSAQPVKQ